MKLLVNIVILMCAGVVVSKSIIENGISIPEDDVFCCSQDRYLQRRNGQHYCWEPNSDNATAMEFTCGDKTMGVLNYAKYKFLVNEEGELEILLKNRRVVYEPKLFCLGHRAVNRSLKNLQRVTLVCDTISPVRFIDEEVYGYAMIVSAIFLIATVIIYGSQRKLRDLQGISIINFCGCLAIGFGILSGIRLVPYSDMNLCAARGFFSYFFVITSFFWMNALSIQIFLKMRQNTSGCLSNPGGSSFMCYSIYAWGCPVVMTFFMAIINFMPGDHMKPGIGLNHCWFFDTKQEWIYMYSVMAILISMNVFIFIYSTILLCHRPTNIEPLGYKVLMTLRLFVVMGLPWIFEMISSVTTRNLTWEVLDLINSLQGVIIFAVLVVPLFPCWTNRHGNQGAQYNLNINIDQPYTKFVS